MTPTDQAGRAAAVREGDATPGVDGWGPGPFHIGISGWRYPRWRGDFYPPGLAQRRELEYASRSLGSIEINGSFYALQRPGSYQRWRAQTPSGFVFSVKGPRFVTHLKKLAGVEVPLANFFASGVLALGDRLGPVLWQLPPTLRFDAARLAAFFALLPRTTSEAAELASHHDERLEGRAHTTTDADRPVRHALEVRHASFETAELTKLLREHDIALVCADSAGRWPVLDDVTSDFVYARLHGDRELYVSGYGDEALDRWAARLRIWQQGGTPTDGRTLGPPAPVRQRDVFVYFDNDAKVHAPFDAIALARRLADGPSPSRLQANPPGTQT
jgi:uncharacterized protein YecE (DUF72 family)